MNRYRRTDLCGKELAAANVGKFWQIRMILRSTLWAGIPFRGWEGAKNHKETATEKWKREIGGFGESPHRLPSPLFLLGGGLFKGYCVPADNTNGFFIEKGSEVKVKRILLQQFVTHVS